MKRIRKIKKYGNSYVIRLKSADIIDYGLELNDDVDISEISKIEMKNDQKKVIRL